MKPLFIVVLYLNTVSSELIYRQVFWKEVVMVLNKLR